MSTEGIGIRAITPGTSLQIPRTNRDGYAEWANPPLPVYQARYVATGNVADLTAFTVAQDGVTGVAGDVVLLPIQTIATQCGLYVVGTVGGGTAPLTRIATLTTGDAYVNGCIVEVSEGTLYAGSTWKSMATGAKIVGTHDPLFYPRTCKGTLTLAAGTKTLGATEGLWLFSTTKSSVALAFNTAGGTRTGTIMYGCAVAGRTAGKVGTAAAIVISCVEAGTIQNQDESTVDYTITNW